MVGSASSRVKAILSRAVIARAVVGISLITPLGFAMPVHAQDAAAPVAAAAPNPLVKTVDDFWHFARVGRYDIAAAKGKEITAAGADPVKVLEAFETVVGPRQDEMQLWLVRWQGVDEMKEVTGQIAKTISDGLYTRRADPAFIATNIARLGTGERGFGGGLVQLRQSGELAIPQLIDVLRDPAKQEMHGAARRAIVELGRLGLNPLVAATEMDDANALPEVIQLIGQLGYDSAIPYLVRLTEKAETPASTKEAANKALAQLGYTGGKAGDLFYDLAQKFYYGRSSLVADLRFPSANVWKWETGKGLIRKEVPPVIFNDVMAMRACEYAMSGNTGSDALSLWLDSNYKREADLPQGATDTTYVGRPPAHYYGVTAGTTYLNAALARALTDRNSAVALSAVKSLQEIAGESNFKTDGVASTGAVNVGQTPLIDAMQYGDRRVRFEAAFTIAMALPQSKFVGQDAVVPLLAEAISQTGQPSVLVVAPTLDATNALVEPLKTAGGMTISAAQGATGALATGAAMPATDVVVISGDLPDAEIESLLGMMSQSPKLRSAGKLFLVKSAASQWETRKATDPTISTTTATDPAGIKSAIDAARTSSGALPVDPELAKSYATRSGELIKRLAISRGQVLDLTPAKQTLLGSLNDTRPEVAKLAGEGLALYNAEDAQRGILDRAVADGVADDLKVSLFKSLSTSAKFWGNKLEQSQVDALEKVVTDATNADVKAAAAESRGALNLKSDQARKLILGASGLQ